MNNKINTSIDRLNKILPLKARQQNIPADIQELHRSILYSYIEIGRSLNKKEIAQQIENINDVIKILNDNDMVVFSTDGEPIGAYPFTMETREHKINVNGHLIHSMCALDSLAISPMYNIELEINSVCHVTGNPVLIKQKNLTILNATDVKDIYFGINWNAASANSCCADSLCTEMIFLKGKSVADNWCNDDSLNRQTFSLEEAVEFSAGFFMPLVN